MKKIALLVLVLAPTGCSHYLLSTTIGEAPPTSHVAPSRAVALVSAPPAGARPVGYLEVNGNAGTTPASCATQIANNARALGAVSVVVHATAPSTFLTTRCLGVAYDR